MTVKLWMVFEAVGPEKDGVEESLNDHIETLKEDEGIEVVEVNDEETKKMDNPHPSLEEGFSKVVEIRADFDSFKRALQTVVNYGPTYVQFEGPEKFEMGMKEAQESLQTVADTMHQYAQMGAGGVVVSKPTDETT